MSRYIDEDALRKEIDVDEYGHINTTITKLNIAIEHSRADVVEVVRCKNCRLGKEACGNIECNADLNVPPEYHGYDWFCPNGERRKDVGKSNNNDN